MLQDLIKAINRDKTEEAKSIIASMSPDDLMQDYSNSHRADIPLHAAISRNHKELVQLLLDKNLALVNVVDDHGNNALYYVCDFRPGGENAFELFYILFPHMDKEVITSLGRAKNSFLHIAIGHHHNKLIGSLPPEIIISILNQYEKGADSKIVEGLYRARDVFSVNIALHPEIAENYFYKGNILYAIGKKEKALASYNKAIEIDHTYAEKVAANIQELLQGSQQGNRFLIDYLNHLNKDSSDQESKEVSLEDSIETVSLVLEPTELSGNVHILSEYCQLL